MQSSGIRSKSIGIKGHFNGFLANNLGSLLKVAGGRLFKRFVADTKDVKGTQQQVLEELMRYAADTEYGRNHGFSKIRSIEDYRAAVPVVDYEDLRSDIDRHAAGEEGVLFPGKPLMYTRTSGTTALPKLIPITPFNFERAFKNRGKLWLYSIMRHYPGIFDGKDLTLVSPAIEGYTEDGTPFGSLSGFVSDNIPEFMKLVHTVPHETVDIEDHPSKIYTLVRFALPSDVTVLLTANPASVIKLVETIDSRREDLIRDIHDGTLNSDVIMSPESRALCEARLSPAPARAKEIEQLAKDHERLRTCHYWPNLRLVHTWTNGNCRLLLPKLRPWLGDDTPLLDFGYLASEATATDVIDPETQGSVLQVRNMLFEFTPESEGDSPKTFLQPHEVEVGERYFVYVSTFSGLYRYDMNDVLEVAGFFNEVPIVRFLYKGKGITSLQGEKLSEEQFIEAVESATEATETEHDFFVGFADAENSRYVLYVELHGEPDEGARDRFAAAIDDQLCKVNIEYESKRKSERLSPLRIVPLGAKSFDRYRAMRLAEGALDGQLKWLNLCRSDTERDRMEKLAAQT